MIIQGKRAIAFFDILGFKAKIESTPLGTISSTYENLIRQTDGEYYVSDGGLRKKNICYRFIFSDSIFLISEEDSVKSSIDMLSYAWRLMQVFIASGYPLRGAVTYGDIYSNFELNVFLGKSISQAVLLEAEQDWIGAVVDNNVFERYTEILNGNSIESEIMKLILPMYAVYFKDGFRHEYHVINWRQNMVSKKGIRALFKNESNNQDVQRKIDNTLSFSKSVVDAKNAYFNDDLIPQRYRRFYIADGPPPKSGPLFVNGDEY